MCLWCSKTVRRNSTECAADIFAVYLRASVWVGTHVNDRHKWIWPPCFKFHLLYKNTFVQSVQYRSHELKHPYPATWLGHSLTFVAAIANKTFRVKSLGFDSQLGGVSIFSHFLCRFSPGSSASSHSPKSWNFVEFVAQFRAINCRCDCKLACLSLYC